MRKLKLKYHAVDEANGHKMYLYGNVYMNVEVDENIFNNLLAGTLELQARELRDANAARDFARKAKALEVEIAALTRDKKRGKR